MIPDAPSDDGVQVSVMSREQFGAVEMSLLDLIATNELQRARIVGEARGVRVTSIEMDSRLVRRGALFCCVRGERFDGHLFAADAIDQGACALLVDHPVENVSEAIPQIVVDDVRSRIGVLAARFVGEPSRALQVVGITGTNGKTTTTHLLAAIMRASGRRTETLGTLHGRLTTPEAPELQNALAEMRDDGVEALAMEVSSHALAYDRIQGMHFRAAVFTNLSRDHLDFHGTMENYFSAKSKLFTPELSTIGIVNADDEYGRRILERKAIPMVSYSRSDAENVEVSVFHHAFDWDGRRLRIEIGGHLNVMNSLAAATTARELGVSTEVIAEGLAAAGSVPGRFERIDEGQEFTVLVDYAHTPDGLSEVLRSVRAIPDVGRVIVVFGCGGDRDKMKRPMMGEVAASLADVVIVTSDNPRTEDPEAIIESIIAGIPDHMRQRLWERRVDRAQAIASAIALARSGDVVLITGKGHEATQTIGTEALPFDDRVVARDVLRSSR